MICSVTYTIALAGWIEPAISWNIGRTIDRGRGGGWRSREELDWRGNLRLGDGSDSVLNAAFTWNSFIEFIGRSGARSMSIWNTHTTATCVYSPSISSARSRGFAKRYIARFDCVRKSFFPTDRRMMKFRVPGETGKGEISKGWLFFFSFTLRACLASNSN